MAFPERRIRKAAAPEFVTAKAGLEREPELLGELQPAAPRFCSCSVMSREPKCLAAEKQISRLIDWILPGKEPEASQCAAGSIRSMSGLMRILHGEPLPDADIASKDFIVAAGRRR